MIIVRLTGGPFDAGVVGIQQSNTTWLFMLYEGPLTTRTLMAEWPHDDAPVGRPPLPPGPIVTYRLTKMNREAEKAEFEYDAKHSDVRELPT